MIKNFDWSKLQRKNEPNNRVSVCGNGIEDLAGHVSLVEYHLGEAKEELSKLSDRYTTMVIQNSALAADNERLQSEQVELIDDLEQNKGELIRACAELSGIKKQEPVAVKYETGGALTKEEVPDEEIFKICCRAQTPLYANPVHQHSFTLSGIGTFYADSELEITYLERLHGVGGKANLKEVT